MWISLLTISAQCPGSPHVQHDKGCCLTFGDGRCQDGLEFPVVTPVCGVGAIESPVLGLKDGCGGVSSAEEVAWVSGH